jgi:uncharacterized RDD family membrane protein YckC
MIIFRMRLLWPLLVSSLIALMLAVAMRGAPALAASAADHPAGAASGSAASAASGPPASAASGSGWADDSKARGDDESRARDDDGDDDRDGAANDDKDHADAGDDDTDHHGVRHRGHGHDDSVVTVGSSATLGAGEEADSVVAIFGSSTSAGVADDVGAIFGNTHDSGPVKESVFAIFGNVYVDGPVGEDVVAVFGNVELGPHADVRGDVSAVMGKVKRDPAALVHGEVNSVGGAFGPVGVAGWLQPWIEHCLLYGRPLALVQGIGWAWSLALGFLALYVCLALLFPGGVGRCVTTLETEPGMSVVAALLTLLLTPITIVLLCITVVGIAVIPFLVFGLFCMGLFGKAVMLAWLGRRCLSVRGPGVTAHPALAVLVGGALVLVLYLVPVLGFIVYKVLGILGLGVVAYTLVTAARAHQQVPGAPAGSAAAGFTAGAAASAAGSAMGPAGYAAGMAGSQAGGAGLAAGAAGSQGSFAPSSAAYGAGAVPGGLAGAAPGAGAPAAHTARAAVSSALPRAGFWIRMAALLVDALLVGILLGIVHHHGDFFLVVLAVYAALMWKLRGTTVGGIVFDLQVVRLDERPIGWETAIVRALGCFLSMFVAGLGFFWIAFDHGKQAWHDKIAGTVVVRVPKGGVSLV